ncbi:hypothetical protein J7I98_18325 [Streptomyces sp. ISL-98]|uniref:hypothetical protein n=1 Tax=Streptomyces sp. ISL-98 TaxID=2819192 RepID=UPI001BE9A834|nr:hypothetical protein [Streptomyces sp. ISL-98]MBT2507803.1 hypothetical protein [Streptomyces sp. ISL-98]
MTTEDVAQLVSILGHDASEHRPPTLDGATPEPLAPSVGASVGTARSPASSEPAAPATPAAPAAVDLPFGPPVWPPSAPKPAFGDPFVTEPGGNTVSPALRSVLRWPAALLLACGIIHLPTDFAHLRSVGYADAFFLAVTLLSMVTAYGWLYGTRRASGWQALRLLSASMPCIRWRASAT